MRGEPCGHAREEGVGVAGESDHIDVGVGGSSGGWPI